ncbi:MAG: HupE/UreJ family protein [Myxococcaceae bacterium]
MSTGIKLPGCTLSDHSSKPLENDGLQTDLRFSCTASSAMTVDYSELFARLGPGHRHFAKHDGADDVLYLGVPSMKLGAAPAGNAFTSVVPIGIEHILTGWDHLLFLLGLLLGAKNLRGVLKLATAFTVGHSVTLALAALQIWAPPVRLTESLIAASVVFVGVQNLRRKASEKHWPLALGFGLIHGFGLAGALEAVALEGKGLLVRLFAFNVGVECGQLMVLLPLLPLLAYARKQQAFERRGVPVLGLVVVVAGGVALIQRALGIG